MNTVFIQYRTKYLSLLLHLISYVWPWFTPWNSLRGVGRSVRRQRVTQSQRMKLGISKTRMSGRKGRGYCLFWDPIV